MTALDVFTNGSRFLHPAPNANASFEPHLDEAPLATLDFEPVHEALAPGELRQWHGVLEGGDHFAIELRGAPREALRVELLDPDLRVLAFGSARGASARIEVRVPRAGIHYVRVRNIGGTLGRYLLRLRVQRVEQPRRGSSLRRVLAFGRALKRAAAL